MAANGKPHFGVNVPQIKRTWQEASAAALEFESLGFDSIWVNDHLYGPQSPSIPILEAWSAVSALAAVTDRVEIGTLVTPAGMRNPAHLGKVIATADEIAGGRVIPGLGGGWMEREFTDFGMPFLSTRERLRQLEETVVLLKRMWSEDEPVTYEGKHVRVENLVCEPKPPRTPPILIGGAGERVTLRIAAQHADIYNNLAGHHSNLARKVDVLREHCAGIGRDPAGIRVSQQCLVTIAPDEASAAPMIDRAQKIFGGHLGDPTGPLALSGSPERIRDQIAANQAAGCDMFVIEFFGRDTREPARLFAGEGPAVRLGEVGAPLAWRGRMAVRGVDRARWSSPSSKRSPRRQRGEGWVRLPCTPATPVVGCATLDPCLKVTSRAATGSSIRRRRNRSGRCPRTTRRKAGILGQTRPSEAGSDEGDFKNRCRERDSKGAGLGF